MMKQSQRCSRRDFSKWAATSIAVAGPAINVLGANEKIQIGFIGQGGRGTHHLRQFVKMDDVKVTALCDAYRPFIEKNSELVDRPVLLTQDFREVLDSNDVDAVVIASPDHWHAHQAIYACQAGKDIYVEKPMSHTVEEGLRLVEAVDQYKRVAQVGQQQRSSEQFQRAVSMVQNGEIGNVTSARCINIWKIDGYLSPQGKHGIGVYPDSDVPDGLDYDMWLGPAPKRPYNKNHFKTNFYFFLDYSGGMLTAWGVHLFDIVMWAMGSEMSAAACMGGKFAHDDERDTPDTAEAIWDTPGYTFSYTLRHGNGFPYEMRDDGIDHGIYFYGDQATILVNRRHLILFPENDRKNPAIIPAKGGDIEHKRNFLDCIRTRKDPVCTVQNGFDANLPGLLALIAWQVKREIKWDHQQHTIIGDRKAKQLLSKKYRKPWTLPRI
jgi:predicted dehydrogenase